MTETELKALVERVLAELAVRAPALAPAPQPTGPSALVVFSGALLGFEDALASLKRLRSSGMRLDYVQTDAAQHILDQDAIAAAGLTPASASLTEVLPKISDQTYSFDGSASLVDQLKAGAPADVFVSADKPNMDKAIAAGVMTGTPTQFASNVLVLVTPAGNPAKVTGLDASLDGKKLVVCAVGVPCGKF